MNFRIPGTQVRLIGDDGEQLGVFPRDHAIRMAKEKLMDLVEIDPNPNPPVCRILDFKKFLYEQKKKSKDFKKKQKADQQKEIRFGPGISEHDFEVKCSHIEEFLKKGHRVKISVRFRGRENLHKDIGYKLLEKIVATFSSIAKVDRTPKEEERNLFITLIPL